LSVKPSLDLSGHAFVRWPPRDVSERRWDENCPSRSPGLSHAHWALCAGNHTDPRHALNQCCHCGQFIGSAPAPTAPMLTSGSDDDETPTPPFKEPQRRVRPAAESSGSLDEEDKHKLWFYVNFCRPQALEPEPVEPLGEYASLFRSQGV
jgi:hypothetical protein